MITLWIGYVLVFGLVVAVATRMLDVACRIAGKPSRFVWIGAVGLAVAGPPALGALRAGGADRAAGPLTSVPAIELQAPGMVVRDVGTALSMATRETYATPTGERIIVPRWLDRSLLALWGLSSVTLLLLLTLGAIRTRRAARRWRAGVLDDTPVHFSDDVGPALVGVLRPRIVVPEWLRSMPSPERALVLAHELEHARARDPLLLAAATLAVVLFPWNGALWYIARRLRRAVEADCDRRVAPRVEDVRRYCRVLLGVSERVRFSGMLATALARPKSDLRWRIEQMTKVRSRHRSSRILGAIGLCVVFLAISCGVPTPPAPAPKPLPQAAGAAPVPQGDDSIVARLRMQPRWVDSALYSDLTARLDSITANSAEMEARVAELFSDTHRVRGAVERTFPDVVTGERQAGVGLWLFVDVTGAVLRSKRTVGTPVAPAVNTEVVAREFPGVSPASIDEVRILDGDLVGAPGAWVVWAVYRRRAASR